MITTERPIGAFVRDLKSDRAGYEVAICWAEKRKIRVIATYAGDTKASYIMERNHADALNRWLEREELT